MRCNAQRMVFVQAKAKWKWKYASARLILSISIVHYAAPRQLIKYFFFCFLITDSDSHQRKTEARTASSVQNEMNNVSDKIHCCCCVLVAYFIYKYGVKGEAAHTVHTFYFRTFFVRRFFLYFFFFFAKNKNRFFFMCKQQQPFPVKFIAHNSCGK